MHLVLEGQEKVVRQETQSGFKSKGPDETHPGDRLLCLCHWPVVPIDFLVCSVHPPLGSSGEQLCVCWCSDAVQEFGSAAPVFKACPVTTEGHVTAHTHPSPIGMSRDGCCETEFQWHIWILLSTAAGSDSSPGCAGQAFSCSCLFVCCCCCCCQGTCLCLCSLTNLPTGRS